MKQPTHPRAAGGPDYAALSARLASDQAHPRDLDREAPEDAPDEQPAPERDDDTPEGYEDPGQVIAPQPPKSTALPTVGERTAATLDSYTSQTIETIRAIRARLDALETFFVEDAAQVKERISLHMRNGQRVSNIVDGLASELRELEKTRDEMLTGHARGTR